MFACSSQVFSSTLRIFLPGMMPAAQRLRRRSTFTIDDCTNQLLTGFRISLASGIPGCVCKPLRQRMLLKAVRQKPRVFPQLPGLCWAHSSQVPPHLSLFIYLPPPLPLSSLITLQIMSSKPPPKPPATPSQSPPIPTSGISTQELSDKGKLTRSAALTLLEVTSPASDAAALVGLTTSIPQDTNWPPVSKDAAQKLVQTITNLPDLPRDVTPIKDTANEFIR